MADDLARREYQLEDVIRFGGGRATQAANAAELAELRRKAGLWDAARDLAGEVRGGGIAGRRVTASELLTLVSRDGA